MIARNLFFTAQTLMLALAATSGASAQYNQTPAAPESAYVDEIKFTLERNAIIEQRGCVPYAVGEVFVKSQGPVETMDVSLKGLPPNIEFDLFITQLPNPPFGLSWYQGDITTDAYGNGHAQFIGRFNEETFIVATGAGPAPQVHLEPNPDAAANPVTQPVHTYHVGLWFNSAADAGAAGCPDFPTPFNGEHNAGVQVLTTRSFPDLAGPLSHIKP